MWINSCSSSLFRLTTRYHHKEELKFVQQAFLDIWAYFLHILENPDISLCVRRVLYYFQASDLYNLQTRI
ncbi:uncharacterized protein [Blastocystis hominis]|uniref:Uncharacterized protein n=1 Tax=Blastocystis hominis TaxID=12968 RepID=D8M009_BLAHO|nr:uncharacterized protein [Blastocystis hominis]CBK21398.2 unnamed protein product [Blastocystis hominis]|eukprot:XP_012895446.1 uncharacterized protein [Blastocystis hominis]